MDSWKLLLLHLLVIGLLRSGLGKPSSPKADSASSPEYQGDEDYSHDYDDDSEQKDSNNVNQKPANKNLNSNGPPAFFRLSNYSESVKIGESVTLKCELENIGAVNVIIWYKNKAMMFQNSYRVITDDRFTINEKDHSLTIANVRPQDEDVYSCNVLPNNITMRAKLNVLSALSAHIISNGRDITNRSITFHQGDRIEIECKAEGHVENVEIKWSADGTRIVSDDKIQIDGGRLVINKADRDHVRMYQCLADNGSDGTGHASIKINIQYTPRVTVHRAIVNTKEGDNAELYCDFESSSQSNVIWRKDKQVLPIDNHGQGREQHSKFSVAYTGHKTSDKNASILVISKVTDSDLGEYECIVKNAIGSENVSIQLTYVPEPPQLRNMERDGQTVITHWHIRSLQPLTEVMLNYQEEGTKHWLTQSPIDQEQSKEHSGLWKIKHKLELAPGTWHVRVKAKNTEGWSTYSTQEAIIVPDKNASSSSLGINVISSISCAIWFASLISIYSINLSARLFG